LPSRGFLNAGTVSEENKRRNSLFLNNMQDIAAAAFEGAFLSFSANIQPFKPTNRRTDNQI
jgi:hypothetical protein